MARRDDAGPRQSTAMLLRTCSSSVKSSSSPLCEGRDSSAGRMLTYACLLEPIRPTSPPPLLSDQQDSKLLCGYCENIATSFQEISGPLKRGERLRPVEYARLDSFPDFPTLKTSAEQGCACCALLRFAIRKNWSLRRFTEYGTGDFDDGTPLYAQFLATEWDGQVRIDDLRFATSSKAAERVEFLTMRIGPSAYSKIKGPRVIGDRDPIDTLNQISTELMLKVFKPARSSDISFASWSR